MEELDKSKSGNPMEGEARGKMSIEEFLAKDERPSKNSWQKMNKKTCSVS